MSTADALRRYPLLAVLGPAVDEWAADAGPRPVQLGETLFRAGTPGTHAYLVRTGRVRVLLTNRGGREIALGSFGPGELFGEYALLPPGNNTGTCRVAEAGEVLELPLGKLRAAVAADPAVGPYLKQWLRLHAALGHLRDRSFLGFMSAESLLPLLDWFEPARFSAGQTIQADGLSADALHVVTGGRVRVTPTGGAGRALGPGDVFGEGALAGRAGLPLAEAEEDTECLVLRRAAFLGGSAGAGDPNAQSQKSFTAPVRREYPWVGQREAADCGVAALAMISRFHGLTVTLDDLRGAIAVGGRGTNLGELGRAAAAVGLGGRAVRVGSEQLGGVGLPAIAHLAEGHYVVLYEITSGGYTIGDPAAGVRVVSPAAFRSAWTGHLLLCDRPA